MAALTDIKQQKSKEPVGSPAYLTDCENCARQLEEYFSSPPAADALTPRDKEFLTRPTIMRYSTARDADFKEALKNLKATLEWRVTNVPEKLSCPNCPSDPFSHCFYCIGIDNLKRVVIYANAAKAKINEKEGAVQHMCHTLEHAWQSTDELGLHPQWVWLVDFKGFSMWNAMQSSTSSATITTFSTHMPERMGLVILINPPSIFDILFRAMRPFIDARTMGKINIVRGDSRTIAAELVKFGIDSSDDGTNGMGAWLAECMDLAGSPGKVPNDDKLDKELLKKLRLPHAAHGNELALESQPAKGGVGSAVEKAASALPRGPSEEDSGAMGAEGVSTAATIIINTTALAAEETPAAAPGRIVEAKSEKAEAKAKEEITTP